MSTTPEKRIVIVGGGIAGLSAAWRLQQAIARDGRSLQVTLLEASDTPGGKLQTEQVDGFILEAGPDSFLSYKPAAVQLARELGIEDRIIGTRETGAGTFILSNGKLEPLPEGITMMVPTKIGPLARSRLLSTGGKLRMAGEYFIPPRYDTGDESIGAFISRRLGREAFDRMAQPLLSGIFAGDADRLSLNATFPRLRDIELQHGGLVRGMLAQRRERSGSTTGSPAPFTPFVSFQAGMGELPGAVLNRITDVDVRTGTAAKRLLPRDGGFTIQFQSGECLFADDVVLATPAYVSADLLYVADGELSSLLRRIPYVSSATISLAYRSSELPESQSGRGFVIPHVENRELTAVTWASNKFPGRAPEGSALLRTFVGRAGREDAVGLPDGPLINLVRQELADILGIRAEPRLVRINRWWHAMPQYNVGHVDRLKAIDQRVNRLPGVHLAGAGYRGVGIPDCIESGRNAAEQILATSESCIDITPRFSA